MATAAPTPATRAPEVGAVTPTPQAERPPAPRWGVAALGLLATAALAVAVFGSQDTRQGVLLATGLALGVTLYHSRFGFTSAWRRLVSVGQGDGLRAHLLMLAVASAIFAPILSAGAGLFDQSAVGSVAPVGLSVVAGAFLFGVGMQVAGGFASGTLYTAGGGSPRMALTLLAVVAGATLAAWDGERWMAWPALPAVSLPQTLGLWPALALNLAVFAAAWAVSARIEHRRHGAVEPLPLGPGAPLRGPWPLAWGAVALALLNLATLRLAGRPWAITAAFPLWGSLALDALGWGDPVFWAYWDEPTRAEALLRPLSADRTTVMDLGLIAGALLAAGLAGRFAPRWRIPPRHAAASLIGGMLLGYGAVLASGCNISAYFSGIASGSLHGWVWLVFAFAGNVIGTYLRPLFGLEVERSPKLTGC